MPAVSNRQDLAIRLEVPAGFGPAVIELQSIALPTWLRNRRYSAMYYITHNKNVSRENNIVIHSLF